MPPSRSPSTPTRAPCRHWTSPPQTLSPGSSSALRPRVPVPPDDGWPARRAPSWRRRDSAQRRRYWPRCCAGLSARSTARRRVATGTAIARPAGEEAALLLKEALRRPRPCDRIRLSKHGPAASSEASPASDPACLSLPPGRSWSWSNPVRRRLVRFVNTAPARGRRGRRRGAATQKRTLMAAQPDQSMKRSKPLDRANKRNQSKQKSISKSSRHVTGSTDACSEQAAISLQAGCQPTVSASAQSCDQQRTATYQDARVLEARGQ